MTHDNDVAQELIKDAYKCNSPATAEMLINLAHKYDNSLDVPAEYDKWMAHSVKYEYERRVSLGIEVYSKA